MEAVDDPPTDSSPEERCRQMRQRASTTIMATMISFAPSLAFYTYFLLEVRAQLGDPLHYYNIFNIVIILCHLLILYLMRQVQDQFEERYSTYTNTSDTWTIVYVLHTVVIIAEGVMARSMDVNKELFTNSLGRFFFYQMMISIVIPFTAILYVMFYIIIPYEMFIEEIEQERRRRKERENPRFDRACY